MQRAGVAMKLQCLCLQNVQQIRWGEKKKNNQIPALLMWIIRCRREQLSDSHPPLHTHSNHRISVSLMCDACGRGRRQSLWPSLWAGVDALRFGAYGALTALWSRGCSDDRAQNVCSGSLQTPSGFGLRKAEKIAAPHPPPPSPPHLGWLNPSSGTF